MIGNSEASVTMPKPESSEPPFPPRQANPDPPATGRGNRHRPCGRGPAVPGKAQHVAEFRIHRGENRQRQVPAAAAGREGFEAPPQQEAQGPEHGRQTDAHANDQNRLIRTRSSRYTVYRYGAHSTETIWPAALKAPMAGSAKVTPTPSTEE